jgi:hypothetical protein
MVGTIVLWIFHEIMVKAILNIFTVPTAPTSQPQKGNETTITAITITILTTPKNHFQCCQHVFLGKLKKIRFS